jgi:perosamine synthetase
MKELFVHSKLKQLPVAGEADRVLDIPLINRSMPVRLSNPDITEREIQAVLDVMHSPNLSCGPKIVEFEEKISNYAGRRFAIAVNSGTSGLHLVVRALKLCQGDEVITTPFSFIASSNCLLYENAKPVFVDVDRDTYNIDPRRIVAAITPRTKAILAVDVFGQPAQYDFIDTIARSYGLKVISDCCESIGAKYKGCPAGSFGVAGVFGFYPNKQITTGEGGVIVTDDSEIARLCRSMRNQGRGEDDSSPVHERLGYNYRLPEISCALGIVQLERIDDLLKRRQRVADAYNRLLSGVEELHLPYIDPNVTQMSWFVYVVRLADRYTKDDRNQIVQHLLENQVGTNIYFLPIHLQPFYRKMFDFRTGDFPITEAVAERTIALPFHSLIEEDEVVTVVARLKEALALRRPRALSAPR